MRVKVLVSWELAVNVDDDELESLGTYSALAKHASDKVERQMSSMLQNKLVRPEYFNYTVKI